MTAPPMCKSPHLCNTTLQHFPKVFGEYLKNAKNKSAILHCNIPKVLFCTLALPKVLFCTAALPKSAILHFSISPSAMYHGSTSRIFFFLEYANWHFSNSEVLLPQMLCCTAALPKMLCSTTAFPK